MTTINWNDRLSEYLDGTLTPEEHSACEAWLGSDAEGRILLEDLRRVVAKAKTLPDVAVPESVWSGITAGIREQTLGRAGQIVPIATPSSERPLAVLHSRRWQFTPLQFAAAAVVLLAVGTLLGTRVGRREGTWLGRGTPATTGFGTPVNALPGQGADASYDKAVQQLQSVLEQNRQSLDTSTVRVLEGSLARIDAALLEAQQALEADPSSTYLNDHLSRIKRKKLDLLRQGASLVQAS